MLPRDGETHGLLALMLHCEARKPARRAWDGAFVPLSEQDTQLWDADMIAEAETSLRRALECGPPSRFALEAAIQSAHAARKSQGRADWQAITRLYDRLVEVTPALGAQISRAAAIGEVDGAAPALAVLEAMDPDRVSQHQPWWATRAHLLSRAGRTAEAAEAFRRAAGLTSDPAVRRWLLQQANARSA